MSTLAQLAAKLMVGGSRGPQAPLTAAGKLGELLADLQHQSDDTALTQLQMAAALAVYERVGVAARQADSPAPTPAPPQADYDAADSAAARLGQQLIDLGDNLLIGRWFAAMEQSGRFVAPLLLPKVLRYVSVVRDLKPRLPALLGPRGQWLATLNPAWRPWVTATPTTTDNSAVWKTGTLAERCAYLAELRDHDKQAARNLVATTFEKENAKTRLALLELWKTAPDAGDRDFLNARLTDRSKNVRLLAADLLSRLPDSAFSQRMIARVQALLKLSTKVGFRLNPPQTFDPAWSNDQLQPKRDGTFPSALGQRAWWLYQLLKYTPLDFWQTATNLSPSDCLLAAARGEWFVAAGRAWAHAALLQQHPDWAEALLLHDPDTFHLTRRETLELLNLLSTERYEQSLQRMLTRDKDAGSALQLAVDVGSRRVWSTPVGQTVLERFIAEATPKSQSGRNWHLLHVLPQIAYALPASLYNHLPEPFQGEGVWPELAQAMERFHQIISLRKALYEEYGFE